MASFATLQFLHGSLQRSQFLGQDNHHFLLKQTSSAHHRKPVCRAEFNILKMMGGRGLCSGEIGLIKELERKVDLEATESSEKEELENSDGSEKLSDGVGVSEDGFEKEMMGLTGGFPGGEKGLIKFIEENPPHKGGLSFTDALKIEEVKPPEDHESTISNLLNREEITVKPPK